MPSIDALNAALVKADTNGDHQNAQIFANQIKQMRASGQGGAAPDTTPPANDANSVGIANGAAESPVSAAIGQAAHQGTFGLNDYVNAGARYAAQRLTGQGDDSYASDLAYSRGKSQGEAEGHPIASTVGGTIGSVLGGAGIGTALKVAKVIPGIAGLVDAAAPKAGQAAANVAKSAAVNAGIGGGLSVANGDDLPTAGRNAAISAVTGPIVGKVAGAAAKYVAPAATAALGKLVPSFNPDKLSTTSLAAMDTLAKTLDVKPQELQAAYDSHVKLTGALPNIAQLSDLAAQGKLKALAAANPEIGEAAMTAASAGNAPLHVQLQQAAQDRQNMAAMGMSGRSQTSQGLLQARDTAMDRMMNAPGPTGVALRDEPVKDPNGVLQSAYVSHALNPDQSINARLGQASPTMTNIQNGTPTIGDVENVRKALRGEQAKYMRPAPGTDRAALPDVAKEFGNVAQQVEGLGTSAATGHTDYGTALNGYRQVSKYETGFNHGLAGNDFHDAPDDFTRRDLNSGMGQAGYAHGNALNRAQQALDAISPASVKAGATPGVGTAASVAHAAVAPSPYSLASVLSHVNGLSLPKGVQQTVAKQLFSNDPVVVRQGIANLKRAGQSADSIRQLGANIGGSAGAGITQYLNGH